MYNMLLIKEKPELALIISNYISKNFNFIRTYAISTNLNEALDILSNEIPDLIIVNYDSLQNSINNFFNYIEKYKIEKYKNSLILFSHKTILSQKILKNTYIASIAQKFQTTTIAVKTNISRSTTSMYFDCNEDYLKKYLNYSISSKPVIKDIIYNILSKITA